MKTLNIPTPRPVVIAGISWGLPGLFPNDLVAAWFGDQAGMIARFVCALTGLSAVYQIVPLSAAITTDEVQAKR